MWSAPLGPDPAHTLLEVEEEVTGADPEVLATGNGAVVTAVEEEVEVIK